MQDGIDKAIEYISKRVLTTVDDEQIKNLSTSICNLVNAKLMLKEFGVKPNIPRYVDGSPIE
jgi:hypothetical protein